MNKIISSFLLFSVSFVLSIGVATSKDIYKTVINGKTVYSEKPQASTSRKIEVIVTPPSVAKKEGPEELAAIKKSEDDLLRKREEKKEKDNKYEEITSEIVVMQDELDGLVLNREKLKTPKEGELSWWFNQQANTRGTRLNEDYFKRQSDIEERIDTLKKDIDGLDSTRKELY